MNEERSSSFSSGSPLLPAGDSDSDKDEPCVGNEVAKPYSSARTLQIAKAAAQRDPTAPEHNGYPNAAGELYPGFPRGRENFCLTCKQRPKGMARAAK